MGIGARQADVFGIVQGVGFRPFVHRLALRLGICGWVVNTGAGVTIWAESTPEKLDLFFECLAREKPPLAHIVSIALENRSPVGCAEFEIKASQAGAARATLISPDVAVCDDCRRELFDPADRRFGYPFINCTNCGPRYTIIEDVPYDRPKTSMRHFAMCERCQAEYEDPGDRRYHAQPNACATCGPTVALLDAQRQPLDTAAPIARAAELIKAGRIVAIKGLGGFHLAVNATDDDAVARLRARKRREEKPLAVMAPDLPTIETFAHVSPVDAELLGTLQRPIVLLPKKLPEKLAFSVAPRNHYYGVMLPYTPLHYLLLACGFTALVMTSANLSEEPIAIDNGEAFERLNGIADYFLVHNRPILLRSDDSIARRAGGETRLLRRSRGFVPVPVFLKDEMPRVLACGGEQKNTVCLTRDKQAFISQHIGDLENAATEAFFELTIAHLQRILDIAPQAVACDLHPDYLSTQWAKTRTDLPVFEIQHHHAHIASCMAEHQLDGNVIGLAFDGTGFGTDGTVWGGEMLAADLTGFKRLAHLAHVAMPGGAAAVKEPWRMALAYLFQSFGTDLWDLELPLWRQIERSKAEIVVQMAEKGINAPLTSSLGRLFDGVAAIIGLRQVAAYEGQAAMELEMIADGQPQGSYPFHWSEGAVRCMAVAPIVTAVVEDMRRGVPAFVISRKFHETVVAMWAAAAAAARDDTGLTRVVLSGGCFQNVFLLEGLIQALRAQGFEVYSHHLVPTNDGGISLGQAVIAGCRMQKST